MQPSKDESPASRGRYTKKSTLLAILFLSFILITAIALWLRYDVMWQRDVYPIERFDFAGMEARLSENIANDVPLYLAVVPVSDRAQPAAGNFPCEYDIYCFRTGADSMNRPSIRASIQDAISTLNTEYGFADSYLPMTRSYNHRKYLLGDVLYSMAHLTSEDEPLYFVVTCTNRQTMDMSCLIIGDTAYSLSDLYAGEVAKGGLYAGAFHTGGLDVRVHMVKY